MARPTVLLFDLDGTLVRTGGAGRRAMRRALGAELNAPDALAGVDFGGRTDPWILRAAFTNAGVPLEAAALAKVTETYLGFLDEELAATTGYRVMPGVPALLDACAAAEGVALGLGTGNIEPAAYAKLGPGKLAHRFAFGGFGSDAEDRAELVETGARRGAEALGALRDAVRVVILGDTFRDVDAAQAIGAECVAVGTGGTPVAALAERGADLALETLEDPRARPFLLG
ncbi:MAG: HAD family hydrolase [Myxococcota bacterium]